MTRRQKWIKNQRRKAQPTPTDFKTTHTGLVLGVEGNASPRFPSVGFSAERRWAQSVNLEARKPGEVKCTQ